MPNDFGPIYTETDLSRFPVEPWNTASNLIFLLIVVYFSRNVIREKLSSPILLVGLPVLLIGFVGGTLFHATRSARIWLYMDFIPILTLCVLASMHFWQLLIGSRLIAIAGSVLPFLVFRIVRSELPIPMQLKISIGYSFMALLILLPAILYCKKTAWNGLRLLGLGALAFAVAIYFRSIDSMRILPMGTHFLWHIFGGLSTFFIMSYLYRTELNRLRERSHAPVATP